MAQRIKVTGYINIEDLEPELLDLEDSTGLSAQGYDEVTGPEGIWFIKDLDEPEAELVNE